MSVPRQIQEAIIQKALISFELYPWGGQQTVVVRVDTREVVAGPWAIDEIEMARACLRDYQTTLIVWALEQYEKSQSNGK